MKRPKLKLPRLRLPAIFRWRYILPRLAIVAILYSAVRWGLDPALKCALVASGEAALGARVEVAELTTSLLDGEIVVDGLAAANPHKPFRNLAEAERMRLQLDAGALLRKRLVVKNGLVRGLKFDSERATSGALGVSPDEIDAGPSMLDPAIAAASDAGVAWLGSLQGRLEEDLESKLATPRVVDELETRWKDQYATLKQRADDLRAKANEIEADYREAKRNPLRSAALLAALQTQLAATRSELVATLSEIEALPAQVKADRAAVDAARKQDQEFLKNSLTVAKADGDQLTQYLLGETAHGYITDTVGWMQYVRSWIPRTRMKRPERARGTNVLFVDRRLPSCLIERVTLTGDARLGGQPLEVTGLLTDATTEPDLHDRPLQLHLIAVGAVGGDLLVTVDRRRGAERDTLKLDIPHLAVSERTLGKADKLAVTVAPGEAAVTANLMLEGEQLSGTIHVCQSSTLAAQTPQLRDDRLAAMLGESLRGVDRLEATIELAGTLPKPRWEIDSNVGPQLADGIRAAARKYLAERRDRLVAKVQAKADEQLAKLETAKQEAQTELMAKLGEHRATIEQVAAVMGSSAPLDSAAIPKIGSALKLDRR